MLLAHSLSCFLWIRYFKFVCTSCAVFVLSMTVKTLIRCLPVFTLQYQMSGVRRLGLLQTAHRNTLGAKLCPRKYKTWIYNMCSSHFWNLPCVYPCFVSINKSYNIIWTPLPERDVLLFISLTVLHHCKSRALHVVELDYFINEWATRDQVEHTKTIIINFYFPFLCPLPLIWAMLDIKLCILGEELEGRGGSQSGLRWTTPPIVTEIKLPVSYPIMNFCTDHSRKSTYQLMYNRHHCFPLITQRKFLCS